MPPDKEPSVTIAHFSDLHFSGYLQNINGNGPAAGLIKAHDYKVLLNFGSVAQGLIKRYHESLIVAVTGDVTTNADPAAYETVNTYLRGKLWISDKSSIGLNLDDLKISPDRLLVVKGNHDAWIEGKLFGLNSAKQGSEYFNRCFPASSHHVIPIVVKGKSFIFIQLDSNDMKGWNLLNSRNAVGRGFVRETQMVNILVDLQNLKKDNQSGFDPESAIRIVLMHHHISIPDWKHPDMEDEFLRLENGDKVKDFLLNECGAKLVLCGHQHFPFLHPRTNPWLSCAGSTTQGGNKLNSFKMYYFMDDGKIQMEEFVRDNSKSSGLFANSPMVTL